MNRLPSRPGRRQASAYFQPDLWEGSASGGGSLPLSMGIPKRLVDFPLYLGLSLDIGGIPLPATLICGGLRVADVISAS